VLDHKQTGGVVSDLDGAVVVVTGAAGGIGRAVSERLAADGAQVVDMDVRAPAEGGGHFVPVDVLDPVSVDAAVAQVVERYGRIDGLVAAAGLSEEPVPAEDMPVEVWDRTMGVNLRGLFLTCQRVGRVMLAQGSGSIVTIASMSGNHVVNVPQQQAAYNASKSGVVGLTKSLAYEWISRGVRVNALSPGYVNTPLLASKAELHEHWKGATPSGRFATTAEVAAAARWLLGAESGFCVGTELLMDGGYSLS
jgi:NAD(P)-dependent dehydrogenase (short-subunit alcohol dehydrogenase family)